MLVKDVKPEKLARLQEKLNEAFNFTEQRINEKPQKAYIYEHAKEILNEIQDILNANNEVAPMESRGSALGQIALKRIRDIDKEYASKLSEVSWEFEECFEPNNPDHMFIKQMAEEEEEQKSEFLDFVDKVKVKLHDFYKDQILDAETKHHLNVTQGKLDHLITKIKNDAIPLCSCTMHPEEIKFETTNYLNSWCQDEQILNLFKILEKKFRKL